jgi:hypothetical protein
MSCLLGLQYDKRGKFTKKSTKAKSIKKDSIKKQKSFMGTAMIFNTIARHVFMRLILLMSPNLTALNLSG